ncbi:unnamed protein product [Laminaria digitata]
MIPVSYTHLQVGGESFGLRGRTRKSWNIHVVQRLWSFHEATHGKAHAARTRTAAYTINLCSKASPRHRDIIRSTYVCPGEGNHPHSRLGSKNHAAWCMIGTCGRITVEYVEDRVDKIFTVSLFR